MFEIFEADVGRIEIFLLLFIFVSFLEIEDALFGHVVFFGDDASIVLFG